MNTNLTRRHGFWEKNNEYQNPAKVLFHFLALHYPSSIKNRKKLDVYVAKDAASKFTAITGIVVDAKTILEYSAGLLGKEFHKRNTPTRIFDANPKHDSKRECINEIRGMYGYKKINWNKVVR